MLIRVATFSPSNNKKIPKKHLEIFCQACINNQNNQSHKFSLNWFLTVQEAPPVLYVWCMSVYVSLSAQPWHLWLLHPLPTPQNRGTCSTGLETGYTPVLLLMCQYYGKSKCQIMCLHAKRLLTYSFLNSIPHFFSLFVWEKVCKISWGLNVRHRFGTRVHFFFNFRINWFSQPDKWLFTGRAPRCCGIMHLHDHRRMVVRILVTRLFFWICEAKRRGGGTKIGPANLTSLNMSS